MPKKMLKLVSPVGTARYAYLDFPSTKFAEIYKVDLIVPSDKSVEFRKQLDEKAQEAYDEACKEHAKDRKIIKQHPAYSVDTDDDGNETGNFIFKFKGSTNFTKKDGTVVEKKVKAFDSKAKPIQMPSVYTGSTIRVEFVPISYYNPSNRTSGISLRILSVQVLDLVTFDTDGKARGYAEEADYSYEGEAPVAAPVTSAPVQVDPKVEEGFRQILAETVASIVQEEGIQEWELVRQLTSDINGKGFVDELTDIRYQAFRMDGATYSPLMQALEKAKKRLAAVEKVPFPAAG